MTVDLVAMTTEARRLFLAVEGERIQQLAADGQRPLALLICCADSRLAPEQLLGAPPGTFFVLRNIANGVPPYAQGGGSTLAVVEFAVQVLEVPHIVVCGHSDCGGIAALFKGIDFLRQPALARWVDMLRPALSSAAVVDGGAALADRVTAVSQENVRRQLTNLNSHPFVRERVAAQTLQLHGWFYDLSRPGLSVLKGDDGAFIAVD